MSDVPPRESIQEVRLEFDGASSCRLSYARVMLQSCVPRFISHVMFHIVSYVTKIGRKQRNSWIYISLVQVCSSTLVPSTLVPNTDQLLACTHHMHVMSTSDSVPGPLLPDASSSAMLSTSVLFRFILKILKVHKVALISVTCVNLDHMPD